MISGLMSFLGVVMILSIHYMEMITDLSAKEYDLDTMTTADYSVSYEITSKMYHKFLD